MKNKYMVEIFNTKEGVWREHSAHKQRENAIINADVVSSSRKCHARIKYHDEVVYECGAKQ